MARKRTEMGGPVEQALGRVLRRLRKNQGLSQERLAGMMGSSRGYLSLLERGINSPTILMTFTIALALDVKPSDFVLAIESELKGEIQMPPDKTSKALSQISDE